MLRGLGIWGLGGARNLGYRDLGSQGFEARKLEARDSVTRSLVGLGSRG